MQEDKEAQAKTFALELINGLLPADATPFVADQMVHPQANAEKNGKQIFDDLQLNTLVDYLMSDHFSAIVEKFYNPQDYSTLNDFLKNKDSVIAFAKKLIVLGIDAIDEDKVLKLLKEEEALKDIKTLDKRVEVFGDFMDELSCLQQDALDRDKFSTLIVDTLDPVLFHKDFYALINELIGFLNEENLTVILDAIGKNPQREQAQLLLQFMQILKTKNKDELQEHFVTFPEEEKVDAEELPLKHVV
ncbi:MAG: hypothetical protein ACRCXC_13360 [Legionella sp.]